MLYRITLSLIFFSLSWQLAFSAPSHCQFMGTVLQKIWEGKVGQDMYLGKDTYGSAGEILKDIDAIEASVTNAVEKMGNQPLGVHVQTWITWKLKEDGNLPGCHPDTVSKTVEELKDNILKSKDKSFSDPQVKQIVNNLLGMNVRDMVRYFTGEGDTKFAGEYFNMWRKIVIIEKLLLEYRARVLDGRI